MTAIPPGIPEPALAQGLHWLVVMWSGEVSDEERAAWQRWLSAHPDHERAWRHVQRLDSRLLDVSPVASARALAATGRKAGRRQALRLMGFGLLGAGVAGAAGLAVRQAPWSGYLADYLADYRSAVGERRQVALEDGTLLTLNGDSAVDIDYGPDARRVALRRGELYIETGHGPLARGRPFFVATDLGSVHALGTRYTVDRRRGEVAVAVYEGAVEIRPSQARPMVLDAGHAASFTAAGATPARPLAGARPAWLNRQLVADRMRLADFLEQVGRHRPGVIRCHASVADLIVSGVYPLGDTDRVLASLAAALPLRISRYTNYWVVVEPR